MIKMSIEQLKQIVERLENQNEYHNMRKDLYVTIEKHPNGREYLQIEQPCWYTECNSHYERIENKKEAIL